MQIEKCRPDSSYCPAFFTGLRGLSLPVQRGGLLQAKQIDVLCRTYAYARQGQKNLIKKREAHQIILCLFLQ